MLADIPIAGISTGALLGTTILMILTGRLIPRVTLTDKQEESDRWRLAYEAERDARSLSDAQTVELLEFAKTTHQLITAMAATSEKLRESQRGDRGVSTQT